MIDSAVLLIVGLVFLVVGSKFFVGSAVRLAKKLNISEFFIGVTFVAIGTSIPELVSSILAISREYPEVVMGNIVGSNVANIGLVFGISSMLCVIVIKKKVFERDGYLLTLSAVLMYAFAIDGEFSLIEALMLLLLYLLYVMFLVKTQNGSRHRFSDFLHYFFGLKYLLTVKSRLVRGGSADKQRVARSFREGIAKDLLVIGLCGVGIVVGADWVVMGVVWLAEFVSMPSNVVALSVLAIGTSLPELVVSVTAARRGLGGFVVGGIIGSNIANSLLVIGAVALMGPLVVSEFMRVYLLPLMAFATVVFVYIIRAGKVPRWVGFSLLIAYCSFVAFAIWFS